MDTGTPNARLIPRANEEIMVRQSNGNGKGRDLHRSREGQATGQCQSWLDTRVSIRKWITQYCPNLCHIQNQMIYYAYVYSIHVALIIMEIWNLQIAELSHSVSSPMSFRVEYKRGSTAPAMFQRQVRFQVDISAISKHPGEPLFAITFTLLSGEYTQPVKLFNLLGTQVKASPLHLSISLSSLFSLWISSAFYFVYIALEWELRCNTLVCYWLTNILYSLTLLLLSLLEKFASTLLNGPSLSWE